MTKAAAVVHLMGGILGKIDERNYEGMTSEERVTAMLDDARARAEGCVGTISSNGFKFDPPASGYDDEDPYVD